MSDRTYQLSEARELAALGMSPRSRDPQYLAFYREGQRVPRRHWNKTLVPELAKLQQKEER